MGSQPCGEWASVMVTIWTPPSPAPPRSIRHLPDVSTRPQQRGDLGDKESDVTCVSPRLVVTSAWLLPPGSVLSSAL